MQMPAHAAQRDGAAISQCQSGEPVGGGAEAELVFAQARFEVCAASADHAGTLGPQALAGLHQSQHQRAVAFDDRDDHRFAVVHRGFFPAKRESRVAGELPEFGKAGGTLRGGLCMGAAGEGQCYQGGQKVGRVPHRQKSGARMCRGRDRSGL